ncbi:MAG: KTSC domain-containing protein [Kiritimatiellia bacterium]|nr:KTSC domain-containing protein [Lentisphaerota bacterium]
MTSMLEIRFRSRLLAWCRYQPITAELQVGLHSGWAHGYAGVSPETVANLLLAPSIGRHFMQHIVGAYPRHRLQQARAPGSTSGSIAPLVTRSLQAVAPHLDVPAHAALEQQFYRFPIMVRLARRRRTRHGDHILAPTRAYSRITVNATDNAPQFFLTILHEIAHAETAHSRIGGRPHGRAWKTVFTRMLREHLQLFPADLRPHLLRHAGRPLYTADADTGLALQLSRHDQHGNGHLLEELPQGAAFSLDGRNILIKGPRLRKNFRCQAADGRLYRVAAAARCVSGPP